MEDIVCEFLEIAIHNILCIRNIYPESIFTKRRKYGIVVYEAEHPQIKEYIAESLKAVYFHMKENQLRKVTICILSSQQIVEKYVFDLIQIQNNLASDPLYLTLEQHLRKFYLQLHTLHAKLKPLPPDSCFCLKIHTTAYSSLVFNENNAYAEFPWVHINENTKVNLDIIPLFTIDTNNLTLQIYIENASGM